MELVVVVKEAVEVLKTNRERHIQDYKESVDVWRKAVAEFTKVLGDWAVTDMIGVRPQEPSPPRNWLREYDKLIAKLGYHNENTIKLNDNEYSTIFEDNFYWQNQFQRQKAPIYTMGDALPKLLSSNSGSISASKSNQSIDELHVPLENVENK